MEKNNLIQKILSWVNTSHFNPIIVGQNCCGTHIYTLLTDVMENSDISLGNVDNPIDNPDLLIINGKINSALLPKILSSYNSLVGKKYVMTLGSCSGKNCGIESYNQIQDLNEFIPVDIHIPGCPPTKEDFIRGLKELNKR